MLGGPTVQRRVVVSEVGDGVLTPKVEGGPEIGGKEVELAICF